MILYLILYVQTLLCAYWLMRYFVKPIRVQFLVDSLRFDKLMTVLMLITLTVHSVMLIIECILFNIFTLYDIVYFVVNFLALLVYAMYNINTIVEDWKMLNKCLSL